MFSSLLKENIADSVLVKLECSLNTDTVILTEKVFVLMQFDPGMEYRPDWGSTKVPIKGASMQNQANANLTQHGIQRGATTKGLNPSNNTGIKGPPVGAKDDKS